MPALPRAVRCASPGGCTRPQDTGADAGCRVFVHSANGAGRADIFCPSRTSAIQAAAYRLVRCGKQPVTVSKTRTLTLSKLP
jgi:hypothetical protein